MSKHLHLVRKKQVNILCIDGGGVRGLVGAYILGRIEEEFGINIYNFFDVYAGTSAGSMIVGALVYGGASGKDLLDKIFLNDNAKELMKQSLKDRIFNAVQFAPKYSGRYKTEMINQYIGTSKMSETEKLVLIPCYNVTSGRTVFFKSWEKEGEDVNIGDVVNASSAAPSFFPGIKINNEYYIDGGVSVNNPTDSIYADILSLMPGKSVNILSIGSGYKMKGTRRGQQISSWGGVQWYIGGKILKILMSAAEEMVDYRTKRFAASLGDNYVRLDGYVENTSIDDTSDENLQTLRNIGEKWFTDNYDILKHFFMVKTDVVGVGALEPVVPVSI